MGRAPLHAYIPPVTTWPVPLVTDKFPAHKCPWTTTEASRGTQNKFCGKMRRFLSCMRPED